MKIRRPPAFILLFARSPPSPILPFNSPPSPPARLPSPPPSPILPHPPIPHGAACARFRSSGDCFADGGPQAPCRGAGVRIPPPGRQVHRARYGGMRDGG